MGRLLIFCTFLWSSAPVGFDLISASSSNYKAAELNLMKCLLIFPPFLYPLTKNTVCQFPQEGKHCPRYAAYCCTSNSARNLAVGYIGSRPVSNPTYCHFKFYKWSKDAEVMRSQSEEYTLSLQMITPTFLIAFNAEPKMMPTQFWAHYPNSSCNKCPFGV